MELTLKRRPTKINTTLGELEQDGERLCYTLEDMVREIPGEPVECWKVAGKTAIPAGRYRVGLQNSTRFGPDTLTLFDVPGFTSIRMHAGNWNGDTEGCLLLGQGIVDDEQEGGRIVGGTSRPAVAKIKALVDETIEAGEEVWITIVTAS